MSPTPTNSGPPEARQPANAWLAPGHRVDIPDHKLLVCVGRGSYGEVWLARSILGTFRAIKIIYRLAFQSHRPFERELTGIRKFEPISRSHPGFVTILHIGQNIELGYFYYVMEIGDDVKTGQKIDPVDYVPRTLTKQISASEKLPFDDCVEIGLTLTGALAHLHNQGLIHRDIKPENIIFVNGKPKLADIGLVAKLEEAKSYVGTPGYIPPEGVNSISADLYSLGKVLYQAAIGSDPKEFPSVDIKQVPDTQELVELNEVATKACHPNPEKRYQTAQEMRADLALLQSGRSVHRLRVLEQRWSKVKKNSAIALLIVVALAWIGYPIVAGQRTRAERRQNRLGAQLAYGIRAMEDGDYIGSLPYFVRVLELDQGFPEHEEVDRMRIGSVLAQCPKPARMWFLDHPVNDVRFTPDGSQVVASLEDTAARVCNVVDGSVVRADFGGGQALRSTTFSRDGRLILTVDQNLEAKVWDSRTRSEIGGGVAAGLVVGAEFNPKGDRFITACTDGRARVYETATGWPVLTLDYHSNCLWSAEFSRDGIYIATASIDGTAWIWNAQTGEQIGQPMKHLHGYVYTASFNPEVTRVVTAGGDKRARLFSIDGHEILTAMSHGDVIHSAHFSPDGRYIVTAGFDSTVCLWDAVTGGAVRRNHLLRHSAKVVAASFSPDGRQLVTGCIDGTVRIWDLASSVPTPRRLPGIASSDGAIWAAPSDTRVQFGLTLSPDTVLPQINCAGRVVEVGFNANGNFALTVCDDADGTGRTNRALQVWNPRSGQPSSPRIKWTSSLNQACLSDDGMKMALLENHRLRTIEVSSGKELVPPFPVGEEISLLTFDHSGKRLAGFGEDTKLVSVWDARTGNLSFPTLHLAAGVRRVAFSPDGNLFVSAITDDGLNERPAQIWSATTGHNAGRPLWHEDGVLDAAFNFDGKQIVTASEDFTAKVWNALTGEPITPSLKHQDKVWGALFSQDGRWVATASLDKTARVWDATTGEPLTPPLEHPVGLASAVVLGNQRGLVTTAAPGKSWYWELPRDAHSLEELNLLMQVLLGDAHLSKGGTRTENARALESAWRTLQEKHPEDFTVRPSQVVAWHQNEANRAKEEGQTFAYSFHRAWLDTNAPDVNSSPLSINKP